jgi:hypothetical protein
MPNQRSERGRESILLNGTAKAGKQLSRTKMNAAAKRIYVVMIVPYVKMNDNRHLLSAPIKSG